ncbi:SRPBCC domain-containing protein [Jiangella gansuensis]|uniref:SRPBCC domain-containing protein n=1 Tax=Jiangella gansuensis TaxID=281473 RepID=UPI00047E5283
MRLTRYLPATPAVVFDTYTDADKQKIWFSILDEEPGVVEIENDLRVGGTQTAKWGPNADQLFSEVQIWEVVEPPRRLVSNSTGSDPSGGSMTTRVEVTFEADGDGTLMTVVQTGFPTAEFRDFWATTGLPGAFDRIETYLTRDAA